MVDLVLSRPPRRCLPEIKNNVLDSKSETMVDAQGCLFTQFFRSFDQNSGPFHKYILAYVLLSRNGQILKKLIESMCRELYRSGLHLIGQKKKYPAVKTQSGSDYKGQSSEDSILPGLHDDIALDCLAWARRSDYPSLACLSKRFNLLIGSGYLYKLRRQLGIIEHWVYLACSLMPWEAFDPDRQRWMRLPRMPCDECFSYADKESLAVGTQLLVFGRELTGSSGEIAIVAGGSNKNGHVLKCAELYNSELGTWETLPDMNLPRKMCSGFFMDEKFYVIGGMSSHTDSLTCGEEYNLETRMWKRIQNMYPGGNRATQSPPLVAVVNNQLYAADQAINVVKKYDKVNNTWNVIKPLPVRADSYNGWGLAFKACGDKLLVIGGHRGPQGEVIVLHSWCPEEGNTGPEWDVLAVRERAGAFVYNCAIMGC
ncbi:hypothetical protein J5N97_002318 [Dioscorea zingiberensis]|uniref:F-box/kelch-repeat protein n=1 Tax=Dioscorea zingiberensis TaxID=325984 RepID=A0A9D5D3V2_9LILI|nr:hypothetical protein J5N97_002318 [Dioscorea zingiberensis]